MIFTEEEMNENWLYAQLMDEINQLHEEYGCPEMEIGGPTTEARGYDTSDGDTWRADAIGDWDGEEDEVAAWAQKRLEELLAAIDRGKYRYYKNQGAAWEDFADSAYSIISEFNAYGAFDRLCEEWENHK